MVKPSKPRPRHKPPTAPSGTVMLSAVSERIIRWAKIIGSVGAIVIAAGAIQTWVITYAPFESKEAHASDIAPLAGQIVTLTKLNAQNVPRQDQHDLCDAIDRLTNLDVTMKFVPENTPAYLLLEENRKIRQAIVDRLRVKLVGQGLTPDC